MTEADHDHFMGLALDEGRKGEREGNVPVGSVIVRDGTVLGAGHNEANSGPDATAHAEVQAIRDACRREGTWDLAGATLYSTMEPCPMCCWALLEAGIARLVLGGRHEGMRKHGIDRRATLGGYAVETLLELTNRELDLVTGVRTHDCERLRLDWMG